ncbi:MAG: STAS domain-containing protein [Zetaproteobacteria bacterium]|nr:STAS domain-containing protein [Zetaproteobacteria bacterium]
MTTTMQYFLLDDVINIGKLTTLKNALQQLIEQQQAVTIDASKVERIDTAALQLLALFVQTLKNNNIHVTWQQPSEPFITMVNLLALHSLLDIHHG